MKINKIHDFFDLCKHITTSLKTACADFKISADVAKTSLNHYDMQQMYDESPQKLIDFISTDADFAKYNINDTLSVIHLFATYYYNIVCIPIIAWVFLDKTKMLTDYKTIGSLILAIM